MLCITAAVHSVCKSVPLYNSCSYCDVRWWMFSWNYQYTKMTKYPIINSFKRKTLTFNYFYSSFEYTWKTLYVELYSIYCVKLSNDISISHEPKCGTQRQGYIKLIFNLSTQVILTNFYIMRLCLFWLFWCNTRCGILRKVLGCISTRLNAIYRWLFSRKTPRSWHHC